MTRTVRGPGVRQRKVMADLVGSSIGATITFQRGSFRVRRDSLEVWPAHLDDRAWKLSFFGEELGEHHRIRSAHRPQTDTFEKVRLYANSPLRHARRRCSKRSRIKASAPAPRQLAEASSGGAALERARISTSRCCEATASATGSRPIRAIWTGGLASPLPPLSEYTPTTPSSSPTKPIFRAQSANTGGLPAAFNARRTVRLPLMDNQPWNLENGRFPRQSGLHRHGAPRPDWSRRARSTEHVSAHCLSTRWWNGPSICSRIFWISAIPARIDPVHPRCQAQPRPDRIPDRTGHPRALPCTATSTILERDAIHPPTCLGSSLESVASPVCARAGYSRLAHGAPRSRQGGLLRSEPSRSSHRGAPPIRQGVGQYADGFTRSMERAAPIPTRSRAKQSPYNTSHGITRTGERRRDILPASQGHVE